MSVTWIRSEEFDLVIPWLVRSYVGASKFRSMAWFWTHPYVHWTVHPPRRRNSHPHMVFFQFFLNDEFIQNHDAGFIRPPGMKHEGIPPAMFVAYPNVDLLKMMCLWNTPTGKSIIWGTQTASMFWLGTMEQKSQMFHHYAALFPPRNAGWVLSTGTKVKDYWQVVRRRFCACVFCGCFGSISPWGTSDYQTLLSSS